MQLTDLSKFENVLICPLNWGLGHSTRCIPIINKLLEERKQVTIASDGEALVLLRKEFPDLNTVRLPAYNIKYPFRNVFLNILYQLPKIFLRALQEHIQLGKVVRKKKIDLVISDSRFGCFTNKVKSIFITHQLNIQSDNNWLASLANIFHRWNIRRYHECWVPDFSGENNLAGALSYPAPVENTFYIGPVSRFEKKNIFVRKVVLFILSGPEPQRTIFENMILKEMKRTHYEVLLVRGKVENKEDLQLHDENIEVINFMDSASLNHAILSSEYVVSRSGYTTIMDLVSLEKPALLVPTPGQSEQEYLAKWLDGKFGFTFIHQEGFNAPVFANWAKNIDLKENGQQAN